MSASGSSPGVSAQPPEDRQGMCGHQAPHISFRSGQAAPDPVVCELRWGHGGWHETNDGMKWSALGPVFDSPDPTKDYSDDRHQLAMVIHDGGCQCRGHTLGWTIRSRDSLQLADAILAAGFRRVAEDPETAAKLADIAQEVRGEASIAARPGQLDRLESAAERIEAVAAALWGGDR